MKVIIFSDTHDSIKNINSAFSLIEKKKIESDCLIHCGDICSLKTLSNIVNRWKGELHFCFGNMDGEGFSVPEENPDFKRVHLYNKDFGQLEVDGRRIVFQHFPEVAKQLLKEGSWDAIFFGHTHKKYSEHIGQTLLANSGNVCGIKYPASFAVYSTDNNSLDFVEI